MVTVNIQIEFDLVFDDNEKSDELNRFKNVQKALDILSKNAKVTDLKAVPGTNVYKLKETND